MKLLQALENTLKREPNYVTDNGELKKWVVISKAYNYDAELIALLLEDADVKETFFIDVKGVLVFKQSLFIQFLEQKNYLNDSYTAYKNKVGLTIDGKYLKQRNEVALVWPFKDCVLEGGQSREEDSREEIFFNETLAQDEITQLLEPKILTNAKRYTVKGEIALDKFKRNEKGVITDNLIIKGNNLLGLHTLKEEFAGQVKLIYIDPPYNTDNDGFRYNDSFNHSTWLTFMKNRLEVAKKLLHDNGAVFIQLDDKEMAYLKVLCDEIFGVENFRECIVVNTSTPSGVNAVNVKKGERLFKVKEYLFFYSKNPQFRFYPMYIKSKFNKNYKYSVEKKNGKYEIIDLQNQYSNPNDLENFVLNNSTHIYSLEKNNKKAGDKIKKIIEASNNSSEVIEYINTNNSVVLVYNGGVFIPLRERVIEEDGKFFFGTLISDLWCDEIFQTNQTEGGVQLPGGKKPEKLLKRIIELTTKEKDIVLDYHLGSGTTAATAHKLKRQYIGLEQLNYGENDSVARMKNVIAGDVTGISKAVNWKGGGEFVYLELKKYNQNFIEQIETAKDAKAILKIWAEMKDKSFLNYNVDIQKQEQHIEAFKALTLAEQKQHLIELLDKNQLYVNLSSLNDKDFAITAEEKSVTQDFYQLKK